MFSLYNIVDKEQLGVIGAIIGICLSLSPIPTFIDIAVHSKSTGGYSVAPYISSLMCCCIWLTYAFLAGSSKAALIPLNALSFLIYSGYCGVFLFYAHNKGKVMMIYMGALAVVALTVVAAIFIQSLLMIGILATVANCLMFAAPLAVMNQVVQTKSVRYMPFLLSLSSFLCALVWLVWAFMAEDYFVLIPNGLGTFFGLIQLVLYGIYWRMGSRSAEEPEADEPTRLPGWEGRVGEEELTPMKKRGAANFETMSTVSTNASHELERR